MQRMSGIDLPPEPPRFSTMIAGLDACLAQFDGGPQGVPPGTSILLQGIPGGGKSTIATYMAAAQTGRDSLILSGEEKPQNVKARWNRLSLSGNNDPFITTLKTVEKALEDIRDISVRPIGPGLGFVIVDSIQTVTCNGKRKWDAQLEAAEMLVGTVTSLGGVLVIISHVNKSGKDHQGAASLAHLVDIHLHLSSDARNSSRALEVRKNRVGRAGFQVPVIISQSGISVGSATPLSNSPVVGVPRNAQERARDVAYNLLLEGGHVNGYSIFDLPADSGVNNAGYWRNGLEMAVNILRREGYEVTEENVNRRNGWRITRRPNQQQAAPVTAVPSPPAIPATPVPLPIEIDSGTGIKAPDAPNDPLPIEID